MENLINKIKPIKDTENIRNNILISKMEKIKEMPVIAVCIFNFCLFIILLSLIIEINSKSFAPENATI